MDKITEAIHEMDSEIVNEAVDDETKKTVKKVFDDVSTRMKSTAKEIKTYQAKVEAAQKEIGEIPKKYNLSPAEARNFDILSNQLRGISVDIRKLDQRIRETLKKKPM